MPFFDILVLVVLALGLALGWRLRASQAVCLGLAVVAGLWAARLYAPDLLPSLTGLPPWAAWAISWVLPAVVVAVGVWLLGKLLLRLVDALHLRWLDHALGALLAAAVLLAALAWGLAGCAPKSSAASAWWVQRSAWSGPLLTSARDWLPLGQRLLAAVRSLLVRP